MKKGHLNLCNWSLLPLTIIMLASAIQLEATDGKGDAWVWLHIVTGIALTAVALWHLTLHYSSRWEQLFSRKTGSKIKWMTIFLTLTAVTGIIATAQWHPVCLHTHLGAIHGKLGLIFLFLAITHALHYRRYYLALRCRRGSGRGQ